MPGTGQGWTSTAPRSPDGFRPPGNSIRPVPGSSRLLAAELVRVSRRLAVRRLRRRHLRALLRGADPAEIGLWSAAGGLAGAAAAAAVAVAMLPWALAGLVMGAMVALAITVDDAAHRVVAAAERRLPPPEAFDLVEDLGPLEVALLAAPRGPDRP